MRGLENRLPVPELEPSWYQYFKPSRRASHQEILRVLRETPVDTITVCAVGPMSNIALAAAEDPETFLRMKELLIMGGAVDVPGNITPVAEANTWNDAVACARVLALSSQDPSSTMAPASHDKSGLGPYPKGLSRQLQVKLFLLDITLSHCLDYELFSQAVRPQLDASGPLATFVNQFLGGIYKKLRYQYGNNASHRLALHDPVTVWYTLCPDHPDWTLASPAPEDIRVATSGQWTHGMHVPDRRGKRRAAGGTETEIIGDGLGWLSSLRGNRIGVMSKSPGPKAYHSTIMDRLFS